MGLQDLSNKLKDLWRFFTVGIWTITDAEVDGVRQTGYNFLKTVSLAIRRFEEDNLQQKAAALTYSTLLSIVPMFAIMLAVAKGFGFNALLESQLMDYFSGQRDIIQQVLVFVDSYMEHVKGGVFVGVGLLILLWSIISLISNIENCFNEIWIVKQGRTLYRKVTDYFSITLLVPLFIICSSGISIFISTALKTLDSFQLVTPVFSFLLKASPFVLTILMFTAVYMFIPNTKVRFKNALYAGIFAGIVFQLFQYMYINGQIWVSKYNAIYGSFAALPLLLLWLQLSWLICLLGAEIAYASQHIQSYEFEIDSKKITRRYADFLVLSVLSIIIHRFEQGDPPITSDALSAKYRIPSRLTLQILNRLIDVQLINEVVNEEKNELAYQPSLDINTITVGGVLSKLDEYGSENFKIDKDNTLYKQWQVTLDLRKDMVTHYNQVLVKDIYQSK